ncbi:MAG: BsuBI/PstI family type II restriction endonuclease [Hymenobacter sp.]
MLHERERLAALGRGSRQSTARCHDVVLYDAARNWLLSPIESVTSHGPADGKRHGELGKLFAASTAGLAYITAFPDRKTMGKGLANRIRGKLKCG